MTLLEKALIDLSKILFEKHIRYMVIGGMANAVWGNPRATIDVDVTVWVQDKKIEYTTQIFAEEFDVLVPNPIEFIKETRVLPLRTLDGVQLDIIFGSLPYEEEAIHRAVNVSISGTLVRFCTPEDLILHKIISNRNKDVTDACGIVKKRLKNLDLAYLDPRIRELANIIERPEIWKFWTQWKKAAENQQ